MDNNQASTQPLTRIALSCSGGGYRAAAFHLGSMYYLNSLMYMGKPLLENVELISTVSGGTITGVVYALKKQQGATFTECYDFLMDKLRTLDLVANGVVKLNPGAQWATATKHKNLINAFAEQYDEAFTNGAVMGDFEQMKSHLKTLVFNSTEFNNAVNFRFRNPVNGNSYAGNNYNHIPVEQLREIKLSDVIASSACFPGGFEPLIWPHDYEHAQSPNITAYRRQCTKNGNSGMGVMDGGIYDNQGIESILNFRKNDATPYFDLVIISDVASPYMDPYKPFTETAKKGWNALTLKDLNQKIRRINTITGIILLVLFLALGLLPLLWQYGNTARTGICVTLSAVALGLLITKSLLIGRLKKKGESLLKWVKSKIDPFYVDKLSKLKIEELSIHRVQPLLADRIGSLISLLMNVFLKVVRRLNYNKLYTDDRYTYRRISNLIKELTQEDFEIKRKRKVDEPVDPEREKNTFFKGCYQDIVGPEISAVAKDASSFGTTLWFTDKAVLDDKLNKLVATGQFTMCYNMIEYLEKLIFETKSGFSGLEQNTQDGIKALYERCKSDWELFRQQPMVWVENHVAAK